MSIMLEVIYQGRAIQNFTKLFVNIMLKNSILKYGKYINIFFLNVSSFCIACIWKYFIYVCH